MPSPGDQSGGIFIEDRVLKSSSLRDVRRLLQADPAQCASRLFAKEEFSQRARNSNSGYGFIYRHWERDYGAIMGKRIKHRIRRTVIPIRERIAAQSLEHIVGAIHRRFTLEILASDERFRDRFTFWNCRTNRAVLEEKCN